MHLEARERDTYRNVWAYVDDYALHSPGEQRVRMFTDIAHPSAGATVFDAGCGSGKGALALRDWGLAVTMGDLTPDGLVSEAQDLPYIDVCLWRDLRALGRYTFGGKFDYVYCCDVLEHLPTAYTMLAVANMLAVARRGVFLSVGTQEDTFGYLAGTKLHQTVESFVWWRDHLAGIARIVEGRDLLTSAVFYVEAL